MAFRLNIPGKVVSGLGGILILLIIAHFNQILKPSRLASTTSRRNDTKPRVILFTTEWWTPDFPFLKEANEFCPKCIFTQNQSNWDLSDAIVFHGRMLNQSVPKRSSAEQTWVFMDFETLSLDVKYEKEIYSKMKLYDGLFNWTMSYRRDSDVFVPYGRFVAIKETPRPNSSKELWAFLPGARLNKTYEHFRYAVTPSLYNFNKRRTAAWITSRCNSPSKREEKVTSLSKYVDVDIYGDASCANRKCFVPKWKARNGVDCRLQIHKKYKFYFAFENSICDDYVTEKFYEAGMLEMVPVVYGGADYRAIFPPNSFIDLKDFKSVEALGMYLKYLSAHPKEWLKYFEWRKEFWVQTNRFLSGYCDLCDKLWQSDDGGSRKSYPSVADWWVYGSSDLQKPLCHLPDALVLKLVPYHN